MNINLTCKILFWPVVLDCPDSLLHYAAGSCLRMFSLAFVTSVKYFPTNNVNAFKRTVSISSCLFYLQSLSYLKRDNQILFLIPVFYVIIALWES